MTRAATRPASSRVSASSIDCSGTTSTRDRRDGRDWNSRAAAVLVHSPTTMIGLVPIADFLPVQSSRSDARRDRRSGFRLMAEVARAGKRISRRRHAGLRRESSPSPSVGWFMAATWSLKGQSRGPHAVGRNSPTSRRRVSGFARWSRFSLAEPRSMPTMPRAAPPLAPVHVKAAAVKTERGNLNVSFAPAADVSLFLVGACKADMGQHESPQWFSASSVFLEVCLRRQRRVASASSRQKASKPVGRAAQTQG